MGADIELMAKNIPQAAVGFVESFLAVNFKNISRPGHRDFNDVFDLARAGGS